MIMVFRTLDHLCDIHVKIFLKRTFWVKYSAAEPRNICRNALETHNHRCRAPQYLIPIINSAKKVKKIFLFKFNTVLYYNSSLNFKRP